MSRPSRTRLAAALVALTALVVVLHWLGRFDLRGPSGLSREELSVWADDTALVVATACRWLALAAAWYLLAVTASVGLLGVPAADSGWRRLVPTPVVGAVAALLGVMAVAAPTATHMARTAPLDVPAPTASALRMENVTPLRLTPETTIDASDDSAWRQSAHPLGEHRAAPSADAAVERLGAETTEVRPGDSFWSLAEEHLEDVWGRRNLTDAEIVPYWKTLIEANRAELTDPGNPDLLLPGQWLTVPEAPPDPGS